jgi:hypothetical protein
MAAILICGLFGHNSIPIDRVAWLPGFVKPKFWLFGSLIIVIGKPKLQL